MKSLIVSLSALAGVALIIIAAAYFLTPRYPNIPVRPQITIRIPEGGTLKQLADLLVKKQVASSTTQVLSLLDNIWPVSSSATQPLILSRLSTSTVEDLLKIKPGGAGLEGYLFPDTYIVWQDSALTQLTSKAIIEMFERINAELAAGTMPAGFNVHKVLTLASIIEKEVPSDTDRAMVADVFLKRLKINMPLQSDVTVHYATGNYSTLTASNLQSDNPYNTYKYRGLPPGPVAFPSLSAIHAVLHPQANDYYYFLTTPEKKVIYSKTAKEHQTAVNKYLK